MLFLIRPLRPDEYPLLENFLYEAVFQEEGRPKIPRDILRLPELRRYIENFGTGKGDSALCADAEGTVTGVAWVRQIHGFGHVDDSMPELAVAVLEKYRRQGMGSALVKAVLARLERAGYPGVSLSVQKRNPASRLYLRLGFRIAKEHGEKYVMEYRFQVRPMQSLPETDGLPPCGELL